MGCGFRQLHPNNLHAFNLIEKYFNLLVNRTTEVSLNGAREVFSFNVTGLKLVLDIEGIKDKANMTRKIAAYIQTVVGVING